MQGGTVATGDNARSDESLMNAAAVYIVADGKLSQSYVAERFGVSVVALRRAVTTVRTLALTDQQTPPTEEPVVDPGQLEREAAKERRERSSALRSWIALGLSFVVGAFGLWNAMRTNAVDDRNRQLTARVESATDPSYVVAADHRESLYIRNGSPRAMLDVKAVSVRSDDTGRETPLFQIELGEINGCVDASYSVASDLARTWGSDDSASPRWVLIWTDAGGEKWELPAFPSDSAGDTPDIPYEGSYYPEPTATSAKTDLSKVSVRTGIFEDESVTVAQFGLCK